MQFPDDADLEEESLLWSDLWLAEQKTFRCVVAGMEKGSETGNLHAQCYYEFNNCRNFKSVSSLLSKYDISVDWLNVAYGSPKQCYNYCVKDGDYISYGKPICLTSERGKRSDIDKLKTAIWEENADMTRISKEFFAQYLHYRGNIRAMLSLRTREMAMAAYKAHLKTPYEWQKKMFWFLKEKVTPRHITFIVGTKGGEGKSEFASMLLAREGIDNVFLFQNAKSNDLLYAWNGEEYCVLDLSRVNQAKVNWGVLENFGNGKAFSGKYDAITKLFARGSKCIVLMNWAPPQGIFSEDRMNICHLNLDPKWNVYLKDYKPKVIWDEEDEPLEWTFDRVVPDGFPVLPRRVVLNRDQFVYEEDLPEYKQTEFIDPPINRPALRRLHPIVVDRSPSPPFNNVCFI